MRELFIVPPNSVMPGLVPGIHVFAAAPQERRGWPGRARPWL